MNSFKAKQLQNSPFKKNNHIQDHTSFSIRKVTFLKQERNLTLNLFAISFQNIRFEVVLWNK